MTDDLKMYTQKEVSEILHCNKDNVTMLREIGVLKAIRTGRSYMYPKKILLDFMNDYAGLDVSNLTLALESQHEVEVKKRLEELAS